MRDTSKMWFCSQVLGMAHISINDGAKAMCHLLTHFVLLFEEYSVSTFSTVQSLVLVGFETDAGHCVHVNLARPTNAGSDLILGDGVVQWRTLMPFIYSKVDSTLAVSESAFFCWKKVIALSMLLNWFCSNRLNISFTYLMVVKVPFKMTVTDIVFNETQTLTPPPPNLSRSRTPLPLHNVHLYDSKLDIAYIATI